LDCTSSGGRERLSEAILDGLALPVSVSLGAYKGQEREMPCL